MSSEAQINANRENAKHSTGPANTSASSRNRLTYGLYTREDFVKRDERGLYEEFCETMYRQLTPSGLLEEAFTAEIVGAHWRLRRCSAAEADLADFSEVDPYMDDTKEKPIRSIERARAAAHCALNRATKQLRALQTERLLREHLELGSTDDTILAESQKLMKGYIDNAKRLKNKNTAAPDPLDARLADIMNGSEANADEPLASNCETTEDDIRRADFIASWMPCPCRSGVIQRECCGKNNPASLDKAA